MLAYILQRLAQALLVMLVVGLISFSLFQFVGDPINNMVGPEATIEQRQALRERLGLNDPIPLQFVKRLADETSRPGNGHHRQHRISFPVSTAAGRSTTDVLEQHKK